MTLSDLRDARYITLETFRRNGQGVKTPVWQTPEGSCLYVWTQATSGKAKRIRHHGRVRVCASDARGVPRSEWVEARARLLTTPESLAAQRRRMAARYGLAFWLFYAFARLSRKPYVVIELCDAEPPTGSTAPA